VVRKKKLLFLFVFLGALSLLYFFAVPRHVLYYDGPEYLNIVQVNSFFKAFGLGHNPVHPLFISALWIVVKALAFFGISNSYSANLFSAIFFTLSLFVFNKISQIYLKKDKVILSVIFYILLPSVFIISTNIMVESLLIFFFLLIVYFFSLYNIENVKASLWLYLAIVFILPWIHIESIVWIPVIFAFPYLVEEKVGNIKFIFNKTVIVLFASLFVYLLFSKHQGAGFAQPLTVLYGQYKSFFSPSGFLRVIRNVFVSFGAGFGYLTFFVTLYLCLRFFGHRKTMISVLVVAVCVFIAGAHWFFDFMPRRLLFLAPFLAIIFPYYLKKKAIIFYLLYLFLIFVPNYLYSLNKFNTFLPSQLIGNKPLPFILLQSMYFKPFTQCSGTCIWLGEGGMDNLEKQININDAKSVYLTSEAVTSPYMLHSGLNYHITSINPAGVSDSQDLFKKHNFNLAAVSKSSEGGFVYELDLQERDFSERVYLNSQLTNEKVSVFIGKAEPGSKILFYQDGKRLLNGRIDAGDILVILSRILLDKKDPIGWTYADSSGIFVYPILKNIEDKVIIKGDVENFEIIENPVGSVLGST